MYYTFAICSCSTYSLFYHSIQKTTINIKILVVIGAITAIQASLVMFTVFGYNTSELLGGERKRKRLMRTTSGNGNIISLGK